MLFLKLNRPWAFSLSLLFCFLPSPSLVLLCFSKCCYCLRPYFLRLFLLISYNCSIAAYLLFLSDSSLLVLLFLSRAFCIKLSPVLADSCLCIPYFLFSFWSPLFAPAIRYAIFFSVIHSLPPSITSLLFLWIYMSNRRWSLCYIITAFNVRRVTHPAVFMGFQNECRSA